MLFLLAAHLVLCAVALARIWNGKRSKKEHPAFDYIWTVLAVIFPFVGPVLALAFVRIPAPDNDMSGDGPNRHL